ncbi:hypothetical protein [Deinococcus cellulosilyticus]|uniref:Uncharacterized protein n=1 Tax=Deinococcus cellulosilyticus (strain DSM 18568 / NBRC 106333 / KACC 11606 / 5516J-15) TaxID=1223518 RepID=A0A511NA33_DEIC1|nr:hypothetical protein [Deinococcus cellulosilyticus]GEM49685.1 hypothetical protein DC3_53200 [Deinococcus cellulosilyticus NBRC 106333 = KACC 11606]
MAIPEDILNRIEQDFQAQATQALSLIEKALGTDSFCFFSPRQLRCAVFVARGDLGVLQQALQLGLTDCRDLMLWGEYSVHDGKYVRQHDWNLPFEPVKVS